MAARGLLPKWLKVIQNQVSRMVYIFKRFYRKSLSSVPSLAQYSQLHVVFLESNDTWNYGETAVGATQIYIIWSTTNAGYLLTQSQVKNTS